MKVVTRHDVPRGDIQMSTPFQRSVTISGPVAHVLDSILETTGSCPQTIEGTDGEELFSPKYKLSIPATVRVIIDTLNEHSINSPRSFWRIKPTSGKELTLPEQVLLNKEEKDLVYPVFYVISGIDKREYNEIVVVWWLKRSPQSQSSKSQAIWFQGMGINQHPSSWHDG